MEPFQEESSLGFDWALHLHAGLLWRPTALASVALPAASHQVASRAEATLTAGNDMIHGGGSPGAANVVAPMAITPEDAEISGPPRWKVEDRAGGGSAPIPWPTPTRLRARVLAGVGL